jgi:hypothetical protein
VALAELSLAKCGRLDGLVTVIERGLETIRFRCIVGHFGEAARPGATARSGRTAVLPPRCSLARRGST